MRYLLYVSALLSIVPTAINGVHAVVASTTATDFAVVESLSQIPQGWHQGTSVPGDQRLRFRIGVRQENAFGFEKHVIDISDPDHAKYGQHMKRDELKAMLRPSSDVTAAILSWLTRQGVPARDIQDNGDWINFYVSASEAERILDTKFHYYSDAARRVKEIRTLHYSVPKKLHKYIHMIQPTTRFGHIRSQHSSLYRYTALGSAKDAESLRYHGSGLNATFCNSTVTPQCLKDLYGLAGYKAKAAEGMEACYCSDI